MKKFKLGVLAAMVILASTSNAAEPAFVVVDDVAFYKVTEVQKTPSWCWAASIAMTLSAQGVKWRQEDVVGYTKGAVINQTASAQEMSFFLNSLNHLDYDGQRWDVSSTHFRGSAPVEVMQAALSAGRPMIVTYRTGANSEHAVVLYAANILAKGLHSVYFFDPLTGKKGAVAAKDYYQNTTHTWDVTASR